MKTDIEVIERAMEDDRRKSKFHRFGAKPSFGRSLIPGILAAGISSLGRGMFEGVRTEANKIFDTHFDLSKHLPTGQHFGEIGWAVTGVFLSLRAYTRSQFNEKPVGRVFNDTIDVLAGVALVQSPALALRMMEMATGQVPMEGLPIALALLGILATVVPVGHDLATLTRRRTTRREIHILHDDGLDLSKLPPEGPFNLAPAKEINLFKTARNTEQKRQEEVQNVLIAQRERPPLATMADTQPLRKPVTRREFGRIRHNAKKAKRGHWWRSEPLKNKHV